MKAVTRTKADQWKSDMEHSVEETRAVVGDFANANKRRKDEAQKMRQLKLTYGSGVRFVLFPSGCFDSSYLDYEAAEGIDRVWENRIEDSGGAWIVTRQAIELRRVSLQRVVDERVGVRLSGLAGLYCHFLLLSKDWMKPGATGVWLIPSEWLSVSYGSAIREFLTRHVELLRVHRFDADDVRFDDALVSSCVVWFRNVPPANECALFTFCGDIAKPARRLQISTASLSAASKCPPCERGCADAGRTRIGDHFDIRRGVVTGDNKFFVLSEDAAREKRIPRKSLRPILPSPRHVKADHIRSDSSWIPVNADRRCLLDCTGCSLDELPETVRACLASGAAATAKKNLCASRQVWYGQERRRPAHLLRSYMGRGADGGAPVRFILNDSDAVANNSFLVLYPKGALAKELDAGPNGWNEAWRMLLDIKGDTIRRVGRSCGGGFKRWNRPNLATSPVPNRASLSDRILMAGLLKAPEETLLKTTRRNP